MNAILSEARVVTSALHEIKRFPPSIILRDGPKIDPWGPKSDQVCGEDGGLHVEVRAAARCLISGKGIAVEVCVPSVTIRFSLQQAAAYRASDFALSCLGRILK